MTAALWMALIAMFVQQTFATVGKSAVQVIADDILPDLAIGPEYVGYFVAIGAATQVVTNIGCGDFIRRYGGLRVSQVGLFLMCLGMACGALGYTWPFVLTAVLTLVGTSVATPASSQILARYAPPRQAPLIFSIKQTAVPFGYVVTGLMMPWLVGLYGWQGALLALGLMCAALALILQPTRRELDDDREPGHRVNFRGFGRSVLEVWRIPALRRLAVAVFAFVGLQMTYVSYFVLYLTDVLDYSLTEAGWMFAAANFVGVPARVFWGVIAGRWASTSTVLAALSFAMGAASAGTALYTADWSQWAVLGVAAVFTATALGWHGVLLSEVARLSPPGQAGAMTGGVLAFSGFGQIVVPLVFSGVLATTGSYATGFLVAGAPPVLIGLMLLFTGNRRTPARRQS